MSQLAASASCGPGPIKALVARGLAEMTTRRVMRQGEKASRPSPEPPLSLNEDQQAALDAIVVALQSGAYARLLLHGITGSGKTEVYIRAIEEVVRYGRQAIVLVPEISLTPQTRRRFHARFSQVAVLHSHLTAGERHAEWQRIASGQVQVVVGARSAIFAPLPHLGMIVIDEEHEPSFKQDSVPRYHARDVAVHRAGLAGIPLVLGSATPSLESWHDVRQGRSQVISLPRRVNALPLPAVSTVDLRNEYRSGGRPAVPSVGPSCNT